MVEVGPLMRWGTESWHVVTDQAVFLEIISWQGKQINSVPSLDVPLSQEENVEVREAKDIEIPCSWPPDKQLSAKYRRGSRQLTTKNRVGNLSMRRSTRPS